MTKVNQFSLTKLHLKLLSAIFLPFCRWGYELTCFLFLPDNYTPINNCKTPGSDKMDYSIYTRPASPALSSFKSHPSWKDRGGEPEKAPPLPARPYMTLERSSAAPRIKMVPHSQASLPRLGRRAASLRQTANVQPINSSNPMMMGDPSNMPYSDGGYSGRRRGSAPKPGYFYGNLNEPPYSHSDHYSIDGKWQFVHGDVTAWKHFSITGPLWRESTSDWWIPLTKGQ